MTLPALVIGLGEVLWDLLPSGKVLGGAPANFAYMAQVLGDRGIVASRVGRDELGREACGVMQQLGLSTSYVQRDDELQTGTASITIDPGGSTNLPNRRAGRVGFARMDRSLRRIVRERRCNLFWFAGSAITDFR